MTDTHLCPCGCGQWTDGIWQCAECGHQEDGRFILCPECGYGND